MKDNHSACITINTWQLESMKNDSHKGNDLFSSPRSLYFSPPSIKNFRARPSSNLSNYRGLTPAGN